MAVRQTMTPRPAGGLPGLLLAVLAMVSQLALGAIVVPDQASARERTAVAALDALTVLCDSSVPTAPGHPPMHQPRPADSAICPPGMDLASFVAILASEPEVPLRQTRLVDHAGGPPPTRAPPQAPRIAALPRGPPALA